MKKMRKEEKIEISIRQTIIEFEFLNYNYLIQKTMQDPVIQPAKPQLQDPQLDAIDDPKHPPSQQCFFFLGDTQNGKKLLDFFEGIYYSVFITVVTLITLFADDFRIIFFTADDDISFTILNLICMIIFLIEIVVLSFVKENYFLRFYFWLDLISTLTMFLDLMWIDQLMSGGNGAIQTTASVAKVARASRASKIGAKATKLIRIIRLIRFLKLYKTASRQLVKENQTSQKKIKLGPKEPASKNSKFSAAAIDQNARQANRRWSKLKKDASCAVIPGRGGQVSLMNFAHSSAKKISIQHMNPLTGLGSTQLQEFQKKDPIIESIKRIESASKKRHTENLRVLAGFNTYFKDFHASGSSQQKAISMNKIDQSSSQIEMPNETRVGTKVKDEIQKTLVVMILLIIISIPLFNASTYFDSNLTSYQKGIVQLQRAASINSTMYDAIDTFYVNFMMGLPSRLIYFNVPVNTTCCTFPDNYPTLRDAFGVSSSDQFRTNSLLSYSTDLGSAVVFESTYSEILTAKLNIGRTLFVCLILIVSTLLFARDLEVIALQPLENMFETVGKIALNPLQAIREIQEKKLCIESIEQQLLEDKGEQTQPNALENLIVKIGGLLAVGFGEAGTEIISKVIQNPEFVNVIIPGQKVLGIYGFCDIRNFTDATEILEAEVMVFVNEIAQICHSVVNSHCGSPNKNIGDAFLLVWKYKEGDTKFEDQAHNKKLQLVETKRVKQMADLAVLSFVKMIAEITKSYTLLKYKNNKNLQNRIKDYKGVKMGFGLHVGWSIEGPIGSEYKVDASYLSPSVNMSARLEGGTKQYGVPMLITGDVYKLMTDNKKYLRQVDRVMFDGYDEPTDLYTVDVHPDSLIAHYGHQKQAPMSQKEKKYKKIKENIRRNKLLQDIEVKYVTKDMWQHKDIQILRERYTNHFNEEWNKGFGHYVSGKWPEAIECFKKTLLMTPEHQDGPSQTLISFMESHNGVAPEDWKGFREAVC